MSTKNSKSKLGSADERHYALHIVNPETGEDFIEPKWLAGTDARHLAVAVVEHTFKAFDKNGGFRNELCEDQFVWWASAKGKPGMAFSGSGVATSLTAAMDAAEAAYECRVTEPVCARCKAKFPLNYAKQLGFVPTLVWEATTKPSPPWKCAPCLGIEAALQKATSR